MNRLPSAIHRVVRATSATLRWLFCDPQRVLIVAWLVGLLVVGATHTAGADIIEGPDLAHGAPKTLYETYDYADYKLLVKVDDESSGWFGLGEGVLQVIGFFNNLLLWLCLGLVYGALSLLAWFLNLTLYQDSASEIDAATQMIATEVFWPLIGATVAVAAFLAYARWRGEGRGFISDFGWIVASGALAVGFAAGPSAVMSQVDSVRQDLAAGVMAGSSLYARTTVNPTGYPTPDITGDPQAAGTRKLVDSLWATFGATPWCYAQFRDLNVCKAVGCHALADDEQWQQWMEVLDEGGAPPEMGEHVHWIRGQDMTRTGYLLVLALITIPMAIMLLRLVIAGLITVVGFILLLVVGLVFLTFLPIPGWFRRVGVYYLGTTLGMQFQALVITVVVSGVMVVSVVISTHAGDYGFVMVAGLNTILIMAGGRVHHFLESFVSLGSATSTGLVTMLVARSVTRNAMRATAGAGRTIWAGFKPTRRQPTVHGREFADRGNWRPSRFPRELSTRSVFAARLDTDSPTRRPVSGQVSGATRTPHRGLAPGTGPGAQANAAAGGSHRNRAGSGPSRGTGTGPPGLSASSHQRAATDPRTAPSERAPGEGGTSRPPETKAGLKGHNPSVPPIRRRVFVHSVTGGITAVETADPLPTPRSTSQRSGDPGSTAQ